MRNFLRQVTCLIHSDDLGNPQSTSEFTGPLLGHVFQREKKMHCRHLPFLFLDFEFLA